MHLGSTCRPSTTTCTWKHKSGGGGIYIWGGGDDADGTTRLGSTCRPSTITCTWKHKSGGGVGVYMGGEDADIIMYMGPSTYHNMHMEAQVWGRGWGIYGVWGS